MQRVDCHFVTDLILAITGITSRDEASLIRQHEKELEMKTKMMEAKFHEEKLGIQQRHDEAIQKVQRVTMFANDYHYHFQVFFESLLNTLKLNTCVFYLLFYS